MSAGHLEAYAAADPLFFDSPVHATGQDESRLPSLSLPSGWTRSERGIWEVAHPPGGTGRDAGWKIHLAADHTTALRINELVVPYCVEHGLRFKRLASIETVKLMCAKYAPRASSGKFITIYPADDDAVIEICRDLHERVRHLPGPRILSDLHWLDGPLAIRYGAFRGRPYVDEHGAIGQLMPAPDGRMRPDRRGPVFSVPDGVEVPGGFRTSAEADAGDSLQRYREFSALHFSNSGGVYRAWDTEHERWVVLKEARPSAGFDRTGRSAQDRLRDESAALRALTEVRGVPDHVADLTVQGHLFLVQEFVEGESAYVWSGARQPLSNFSDATGPELREYVRQVAEVVGAVGETLRALHERGVASDDVHPGNVLIAADGTVTLIDLEAAKPAAEQRPASFQVAGFGSSRQTAAERDEHALDMLALWLLLPYSRIVALDPGQLSRHVDWVRSTYPLGRSLAARLDRLSPQRPSDPPRPEISVSTLTAGILETVTAERSDRLLPGAVEAFTFGHACLGYGTSGTLWALAATGSAVPDDSVDWLAERISSPTGYHGLYVGDAGAVWCAAYLGASRETVGEAAERLASRQPPEQNSIAVWGGIAGDGLVLLDLDRRFPHSGFADRAIGYAETCRKALREGRALPAGYFHGWSGVAQFLLECHRHTGDKLWLGEAVTALGRDLDACVEHGRSGTRVALPDGRRIAYLGRGSSGVAVVADEILEHADVPALRALLPGFAVACSRAIVAYPGLGTGRAGTMAVLGRLIPRLSEHEDDRVRLSALSGIRRHREMLAHQLVLSPGGHLAVPGEQALRLSTDLMHGAAGVLLATAQIDQGGSFLPFFTDRVPVAPAHFVAESGGGDPRMRRGGEHADS